MPSSNATSCDSRPDATTQRVSESVEGEAAVIAIDPRFQQAFLKFQMKLKNSFPHCGREISRSGGPEFNPIPILQEDENAGAPHAFGERAMHRTDALFNKTVAVS